MVEEKEKLMEKEILLDWFGLVLSMRLAGEKRKRNEKEK